MNKRDLKRARARAKMIRKRRKRKNKHHSIMLTSMGIAFGLCFVIMLLLTQSSSIERHTEIPVEVKVNDAENFQGAEVPEFTTEITAKGDTSTVLDEKTGYTVKNLVEDLQRGSGFTLQCDGDGTVEGEFPIKVVLTSEVTTPLYAEWFGKVRLDVKDGTFKVKNPYGEWDGDKFRYWDGSYAASTFISSMGKYYYFDENNSKVTGWREVDGAKYYFNKKGVMQTGWLTKDDATYYLASSGEMSIGWKTIEEQKYYFDKEGKMLTGEQKIGARQCVFGEDGALVSEEGGIDPSKPMVALTFDDGPGERTAELLKVLDEYGARATFFMLGKKVPGNEDVIQMMVDQGCETGNHSYDHSDLATLDEAGVLQQINDTDTAIQSACGSKPNLMRPPYGSVNTMVKEVVQKPMIFWSIDTLDWKTKDTQATIDTVMSNVSDGDIILMHDIHSTSVDAAIALIPMLIDEGYQLVTVSEMAEAKGIVLENGSNYGKLRNE